MRILQILLMMVGIIQYLVMCSVFAEPTSGQFRTQPIFAISSVESESMASPTATQQDSWLSYLLGKLRVNI